MSAADRLTSAAIALLAILVSAAAAWIPAGRAGRIGPITALWPLACTSRADSIRPLFSGPAAWKGGCRQNGEAYL